ncbi:MAG: type II secretion system F family protein [Clostridiales bacterium]|nr:type II secretion system F family protein [Candidatus Blautia equi]
MWIHVILFLLILIIAVLWFMGWLHLEGLDDEKGRKLFLLVALLGNLFGMVLTLSSGGMGEGYRLVKEEDLTYEQKFQVSIEGGESGQLYVQIPEKNLKEEEEPTPGSVESNVSWQQDLREAVAEFNEKKEDPDYYYLPQEWDGKKLVWEYPSDHTGSIIAALSLIMAVMLLIKKSREEAELRQKRYEELLLDYPALIMKFTLLIQAGMTVRKAFQKIALDYRRKKPRKKRIAYEEILVTCYEMESGISEAEAYRRYGERCGQMKYKTFATLLIQNLQKGSRRLADMLETESVEAWEERKRHARVAGETASTKLLLPMVMMLMVVMALIMIPAFLSFYG